MPSDASLPECINDNLASWNDRADSCTSYDEDTSYTTDPSNEAKAGAIEHTRNHNWSHDFQEIAGSLLGAGLTLEALGEHEVADWRSLPFLKFSPQDGGWYMPEGLPRIPLTFSVVARK